MKELVMAGALTLATAILVAPAPGDDLSEATALLCSSSWATVCTADEVCASGPPWSWNILQFVKVGLQTKTLSTTEASGENRTKPAGGRPEIPRQSQKTQA